MAVRRTPSYEQDGGRGISGLIEVDGNYSLARALLRRALRKFPDDHWLYAQLSLSYALQRNYRQAFHFSGTALQMAPHCPLSLWYHACILHDLDQPREAAAIFKKLLRRGVAAIAECPCGEGWRRAEGMVNDCRGKLAILHRDAGRRKLSTRLFKEHLQFRRAGVKSVFTRKTVEHMLAEMCEA